MIMNEDYSISYKGELLSKLVNNVEGFNITYMTNIVIKETN